ncbi:hypothetical protein BBP40_003430 [Aspergillus hancockii]|nr:hypothetical protein BBP40_003430 [Aspergillus hancockii]
MKSPLYLLTVLLPLLVQATPTPEGEDLDDSAIEERDFCRVQNSFKYWKYPCSSSDTVGTANKGDTVTFICKYKTWYRTPRGWVKENEKPKQCHGPKPSSSC